MAITCKLFFSFISSCYLVAATATDGYLYTTQRCPTAMLCLLYSIVVLLKKDRISAGTILQAYQPSSSTTTVVVVSDTIPLSIPSIKDRLVTIFHRVNTQPNGRIPNQTVSLHWISGYIIGRYRKTL